jgi:acid phosphatase family membrane protein YuiD
MALTPQQLAALKADILADTALAPQAGTPDGRFAIAAAYNVVLAPAFTVWKKSVSIAEVGDKINATELGGLTTLNNTRLQTVAGHAGPEVVQRRHRHRRRPGHDSC